MLRETALIENHRLAGGRLIDFGGWNLPVQYSGLTDEHLAVRERCGLFDVSHMGEIWIEGQNASAFVDFLVTNDVSKLEIGQALYAGLCNEIGGLVDDLVVYKLKADCFLLVVNASNTDKDFAHIQAARTRFEHPPAVVENRSHQFSQLAIQGPLSSQVLQRLTQTNLQQINTYRCAWGEVAGVHTLIARTGYTGEDGFELYIPWNDGPRIWNALLEAGKPERLIPCGLGCRDTLRLEMKYALYGHELTETTTPLEVGLGWITKLDKRSDFVGKSALIAQKSSGIRRTLIGVRSLGRAIPRQGYVVYDSGGTEAVGTITSGTSSPSLKVPIGVALVNKPFDQVGTSLQVKIREELHPFVVVKTPFYTQSKPRSQS
jgi:aminomethyltransferase